MVGKTILSFWEGYKLEEKNSLLNMLNTRFLGWPLYGPLVFNWSQSVTTQTCMENAMGFLKSTYKEVMGFILQTDTHDRHVYSTCWCIYIYIHVHTYVHNLIDVYMFIHFGMFKSHIKCVLFQHINPVSGTSWRWLWHLLPVIWRIHRFVNSH